MPVIKKTLIIVGIAVLIFEFAEHVLLPLFWYITHRKSKPRAGVESMIGGEVEVRTWGDLEGQVIFRGVLWRAASDQSLTPGEKAVIEEANGLTLRVKRRSPKGATRPEQKEG